MSLTPRPKIEFQRHQVRQDEDALKSREQLRYELEAMRRKMADITTPRQRISTGMSSSESREFEVLMDCMQTHICWFTDPYTYGLANRAHADFLGIEKERLNGAGIMDILEPDQARMTIKINKKIYSEKKQFKTTGWVRNSRGENRLLSVIWAPVFNSDNEVVSVIYNARDITRVRVNQEILREKLRTLKSRVMIDSLTDIPNRRYFDQELMKEWKRTERDHSGISLIMLDIDNFKEFNDNYGHVAGDKSLQMVAHVLSKALTRPGDIIARYGGEEFAALLPRTDAAGAHKISEKMRRLVKDLGIKHEFSTVAGVITISAGSATIHLPAGLKNLSSDILLKGADQALYEAKQAGRNMVKSKALNPERIYKPLD